MWLRQSLFSLALTLISLRSAQALTSAGYCFYGCSAALGSVPFAGVPDLCTNNLQYESLFYCAGYYCSRTEALYGYNSYDEFRPTWPTFERIVSPTMTFNDIERVNESGFAATTPFDHPVIPDLQLYEVGHHTVSAFYESYNLSSYLGYSFYGFWAVIVLIGIASHAVELYKIRRHANGRNRSSVKTRAWLWVRRRLILPATVGQHCQEPIAGGTIPPRLESILLIVYIGLNLIYCSPGYQLFEPNFYYAEPRLQLARYISDRTGILAIINLTVLWVFSTRNDPLLWLTGWSFAMCNRFHRWVARIATIEALAHSIGYTIFDFYYGFEIYKESWAYRHWYRGVMAMIIMSLMLGASIYSLRSRYYELFLVIHFVFAIVFLVTLYFHVIIDKSQWKPYIWACVAIWSLDRLLRICPIIHASVLPGLSNRTSKAFAVYDQQADMIRLDCTDILKQKSISPGRFYFVYLPIDLKGWESHPFTLCSWRSAAPISPRPSNSSPPSLADGKGDFAKSGKQNIHTTPIADSEPAIRHTFCLRPYKGFTQRLKDRITAASPESQSSCSLTLLLEGPYGNTLNLRRFSDVLIIAGGTGIVEAISHARHLLPTGKTSLHVLWATKQRKFVEEICKHELGAVLGRGRFSMMVYLTGGAVVEDTPASIQGAPFTWRLGRPDIHAAMVDARQACSRDLAIVSCGTPQMADASRKAVVNLLGEAGPNVEYFNETGLW